MDISSTLRDPAPRSALETINRMQSASDQLYRQAIAIGNHPFIEFCGLMNEYIKMCRDAADDGIDFTQCSKHSGVALPMSEINRDYINEKHECIFTGQIMVGPLKYDLAETDEGDHS